MVYKHPSWSLFPFDTVRVTYPRLPLFVLGLLVITACSSVTVERPDQEPQEYAINDFKTYVETVFRYQNRVVNDLIFTYEEIDDETGELALELVAAEEASTEACQHLNSVISIYIEGGTPNIFERYRLVETIGYCEYQVEVLDSALNGNAVTQTF